LYVAVIGPERHHQHTNIITKEAVHPSSSAGCRVAPHSRIDNRPRQQLLLDTGFQYRRETLITTWRNSEAVAQDENLLNPGRCLDGQVRRTRRGGVRAAGSGGDRREEGTANADTMSDALHAEKMALEPISVAFASGVARLRVFSTHE
jgi:hypothetical protein